VGISIEEALTILKSPLEKMFELMPLRTQAKYWLVRSLPKYTSRVQPKFGLQTKGHKLVSQKKTVVRVLKYLQELRKKKKKCAMVMGFT
jgi:hypothetical protein